MDSARKFLALALAACRGKQYEEAGIFLGQAAQSEGAEQLAEELGASAEAEEILSVSAEEDETAGEEIDGTEPDEEGDESELDWGDEITGDDDDEVSESSTVRRKETSMFRIGRIMAAAMSVSSDDEEDDEEGDDEEDDEEEDPDFLGETLVPASFSSVKIKVQSK